ncbi:MAG: NADP-dependent oxidoreductase [Actinobacteria bacterium]|nr:NADP-dependent oxidoreductase [Actinomycetota bacterium]
MRAVAIDQFREAPRLRDLPRPEPGPGEVLIKLEAASLNPVDRQVAAGAFAERMEHRFPLILGFDGVGTVAALGAGAERFAVGEAVFGQLWPEPLGSGTFAEYVAVPERLAAGAIEPLGDRLAPEVAAALPTAGMTALGAVEALAVEPGQTLLILGATGGVGSFAVQLAAARGVRVIATARPEAAEWVAGLGAGETLDYSERPLPEVLREAHPEGIDAVLDLLGDRDLLRACAARLKDGGAAVSIAFAADEEATDGGRITARNYMNRDKPDLLARIAAEARAGRIDVQVQDTIALADVADALAGRGAGARGKTVVGI